MNGLKQFLRGVGILIGSGDDQHLIQFGEVHFRLDFRGLEQIPFRLFDLNQASDGQPPRECAGQTRRHHAITGLNVR